MRNLYSCVRRDPARGNVMDADLAFRRPPTARSRRGSALVVVLCFVVLLTVVVLAMLSHSIYSGMISRASSNVSKADIYGHGAVDQILGDLEQEIVAGSTATSTSGGNIYRPKTVTASVPVNAGPSVYTLTTWNTTLPNLVKESTRSVAFYPTTYDANGPTRAAAVNSATDVSRNGHYISLARWNKALLLPKASATITTTATAGTTISDSSTDVTPVSAFVAPDWILTAADGTNPTTLDTSSSVTTSNVSPKSPKYVVGRYAYTIYNEGGLLDANVAGAPGINGAASLTVAQKAFLARKGPSAFADMSQIPGIADTGRGQKVVDSLISWRNASAMASGTTYFPAYSQVSTFTTTAVSNFFNYVLGISNNFMSTANTSTALRTGSTQALSDHMFTGRQQMITFFQNILPKASTEIPELQDSLMYLGTFSRSLNQPSYWPDSGRPKVVGPAADGSAYPGALVGYNNGASEYNGGNSAFGLDDTYNPPFKTMRVTTGFIRNDGTNASVGDPLVAKRFALSRLAWLTCDGPIATDAGALNTSDSNISAIVTYLEGANVGMTANFLSEGGPTNIYKYFGLKWVATNGGSTGSGNPGGYWYYDHGIQISGQTVLGALTQVATAARDPDFFELLQAGINVGGISKVCGAIGSQDGNGYHYIEDSTVTSQIMQIGANIIDEASVTQFPTHIVYPFGSVGGTTVLHSAYGAMDLPYLDSVTNLRYIIQAPTTPASTASNGNVPTGSATALTTTTPVKGLYSAAEGTGVFLQVPSIWNPYDVNGPATPTAIKPTNLRIVVSSALTALNTTLTTPTGAIGTVSNSTWPDASAGWNASGTGSGTTAIPAGLGKTQTLIQPMDVWTGSGIPVGAPANSTTVYDINGVMTTSNTEGPTGTYTTSWTSESSTALTFSNVSTLYREPTVLMRPNIPSGSNLAMDAGNAINVLNNTWTSGVPEMLSGTTSASGCTFIGFLGSTFPLKFSMPSTLTPPATPANFLYGVNQIIGSTPAVTIRLEYQVGTSWVPYMEYYCALQYPHDFVPYTELGTTASPYELLPNNGTSNSGFYGLGTGGLWNANRNASPGGGLAGMMDVWDGRSQTWGFPVDVGAPRLFLDASSGTGATLPALNMMTTVAPGATSGTTSPSPGYQGSHSSGLTMNAYGWYEPTGGLVMGLKQQNLWSSSTTTPTTDYYTDPDGTVRRAVGAYVGGASTPAGGGNINSSVAYSWAANTTVGLPLASTQNFVSGTTSYTAATSQSQARPIILHRPYRSVAELGYVFSGTPWKNIDFATPESAYSALLDVFCINEDYRADAVTAGRVDLNTKQAPVLQALIAGASRDDNTPTLVDLTAAEAIAISQDLVKRTTVGGTLPTSSPALSNSSLSGAQPLSNVGDLVGRWISGTTVGSTTSPLNGAASYDGLSADLGIYLASPVSITQTSPYPSGNYNIIKRFREATMRALSDSGQAGTWNLMIDVVAQSGRYPTNAGGLPDFLVEGERRFWVHVAIDRMTGQIVDENIEPVNE